MVFKMLPTADAPMDEHKAAQHICTFQAQQTPCNAPVDLHTFNSSKQVQISFNRKRTRRSSMEGEELGQVLGVGEHCSRLDCRQVDFLPFKCDCCSRIYCLEHRSYSAHACPLAGSKDTTVIVCPICAKSVRLAPSQDANAVFDAHTRTDCDPDNYARVLRMR
ncbi:Zinc finger AN1 and C2H2 domain-containing stress-associated protein 16 [Tetrabaena socialis]|uniref:Zinc finger AN1 and C2H2 domain-containing stress-associated protein 16 n=1 Tax=Tetrabaena socialis TaxID=47790 RepID=A0A2J8AAE7_9CHLO|nr:Zinc finger AN1 and C2H2 domain-containing stress-associated protein 16 [Tetrabaena socialis]|eukprot:PNH09481.1 Zinc finger AN1 and C2H2 domain-containing stress-associated protein 16 [Tetrabaena socialis]